VFGGKKKQRYIEELKRRNDELQAILYDSRRIGSTLLDLPQVDTKTEPYLETKGKIESCVYLRSLSEPPGILYHRCEDDKAQLFFVGDVAGRGLPAALIAAYLKGVFEEAAGRYRISGGTSWIGQTLIEANTKIAERNLTGLFAAVNVILVWKDSGTVYLWSMGSEPVYRFRKSTGELKKFTISDAPGLGIINTELLEMKGGSFLKPKKLPLKKGDHLLLADDGFHESSRPACSTNGTNNESGEQNNEEFGEERVKEVLAASLLGGKIRIPSPNGTFDWVMNIEEPAASPKDPLLTLAAAETLFKLKPLGRNTTDHPANVSPELQKLLSKLVKEEDNPSGHLPPFNESETEIPGYCKYPQLDEQFGLVIRRADS
jgi:hypothetical protein